MGKELVEVMFISHDHSFEYDSVLLVRQSSDAKSCKVYLYSNIVFELFGNEAKDFEVGYIEWVKAKYQVEEEEEEKEIDIL